MSQEVCAFIKNKVSGEKLAVTIVSAEDIATQKVKIINNFRLVQVHESDEGNSTVNNFDQPTGKIHRFNI